MATTRTGGSTPRVAPIARGPPGGGIGRSTTAPSARERWTSAAAAEASSVTPTTRTAPPLTCGSSKHNPRVNSGWSSTTTTSTRGRRSAAAPSSGIRSSPCVGGLLPEVSGGGREVPMIATVHTFRRHRVRPPDLAGVLRACLRRFPQRKDAAAPTTEAAVVQALCHDMGGALACLQTALGHLHDHHLQDHHLHDHHLHDHGVPGPELLHLA